MSLVQRTSVLLICSLISSYSCAQESGNFVLMTDERNSGYYYIDMEQGELDDIYSNDSSGGTSVFSEEVFEFVTTEHPSGYYYLKFPNPPVNGRKKLTEKNGSAIAANETFRVRTDRNTNLYYNVLMGSSSSNPVVMDIYDLLGDAVSPFVAKRSRKPEPVLVSSETTTVVSIDPGTSITTREVTTTNTVMAKNGKEQELKELAAAKPHPTGAQHSIAHNVVKRKAKVLSAWNNPAKLPAVYTFYFRRGVGHDGFRRSLICVHNDLDQYVSDEKTSRKYFWYEVEASVTPNGPKVPYKIHFDRRGHVHKILQNNVPNTTDHVFFVLKSDVSRTPWRINGRSDETIDIGGVFKVPFDPLKGTFDPLGQID